MNDRVTKAQKLEAIDEVERLYNMIHRDGVSSRVITTPTDNGIVFVFVVEKE